MTAIQQLWLASCVGAVMFFLAGVLTMLLRRRPEIMAVDTGQLDDLRRRLTDAETINSQLRAAEQLSRKAERQIRETLVVTSATNEVSQAALAAADREAVITAEAHAKQLRDAAAQLESLKLRVRAAEALHADYIHLRAQVNETEFLNQEVDRLRAELVTAKAIALGGTSQPPRTGTARSSTAPVGPVGSITEALAHAIERFRNPQMRSIAVADSVGFPVSSYGDDSVELAAYAALLGAAASRANQFLPVASPASIEMVDQHGARISIWPFEIGGDRLMLVNLAISQTDAKQVEGLISDLINILAPQTSASST